MAKVDVVKDQISWKLHENTVKDNLLFYKSDDDLIKPFINKIEDKLINTDDLPMVTIEELEQKSPLAAFYVKRSIINNIAIELFGCYHRDETFQIVEKILYGSDFWSDLRKNKFQKAFIFVNLNPIRPIKFSQEVKHAQTRKILPIKCKVNEKNFNIKIPIYYGVVGF